MHQFATWAKAKRWHIHPKPQPSKRYALITNKPARSASRPNLFHTQGEHSMSPDASFLNNLFLDQGFGHVNHGLWV
jgi:hypothetical protein